MNTVQLFRKEARAFLSRAAAVSKNATIQDLYSDTTMSFMGAAADFVKKAMAKYKGKFTFQRGSPTTIAWEGKDKGEWALQLICVLYFKHKGVLSEPYLVLTATRPDVKGHGRKFSETMAADEATAARIAAYFIGSASAPGPQRD